jgi:hypothetical protein
LSTDAALSIGPGEQREARRGPSALLSPLLRERLSMELEALNMELVRDRNESAATG